MKMAQIIEQDKKLLIKVIAGVVLLVIAFSFYMIKEKIRQNDISVAEIPVTFDSTAIGQGSGDSAQNSTGSAMESEKKIILVDVAGAVANPSVVELPDGSRVFEAIEKAGGLTGEADTRIINQAEVLIDGQKLYIPTKQEMDQLQTSGDAAASFHYYDPAGISQSRLVNINTADSAALQQLTGVGPATAEKIIDYRNRNGKFKTIEEIKNVSGIGDKTFEKFKDKITV